MIDLLADPWADPFMRRALAEVALLGLAGGALGCWVVLARLSFTTEGLAHGLLPGLVLASLTGLPLALGGLAGLLAAAAAIAAVGRMEVLGRDTAVAVVVTGLLGLGGVLALAPSTPAGLGDLMFGDPLTVSDTDLALGAGAAALVVAALVVLHPRLTAVVFDPAAARALGLRAAPVELALLGLVAVTLTVAVQGLGNLLVIALLVAPAVAARSVTRRLPAMMAASAGLAVTAGTAGLYLSYHADVAAGAAIALCLLVTAALAAAWRATAQAARPGTARGSTRRRAAAGGRSAR